MKTNSARTVMVLFALLGLACPQIRAEEAGLEDQCMTLLMDGEILVETVDEATGIYRGTGLIKAPLEQIWQGLTEEAYFTRIFEENRGGVLVEQGEGYDVYCFKARFFLIAFDYCLERKLTLESRRISWRLTDGDFEKMEGTWELQPIDEGRMTLVSFTNRVVFGSWIPESWVRRGNRKRIPETLTALRYWSETGRFLPED